MIIEVTRGPLVESRHAIHWAVADADGNLMDGWGDTEIPVFLRSAFKPFQTSAVLAGGAADAYGLTEAEIAVTGASHHGEPVHTDAVTSILNKSGVPVSALQCGAHTPFDTAAARALYKAGADPTPLHSNCSGKHAGLLSLARHMDTPLETYLDRGHPMQAAVFRTIAAFFDLEQDGVPFGVDGCGLPAPAASLRASAMAYARFAGSDRLPDPLARAAARLREAQRKHPVMVSGTEGFNTALLQAAPHLAAKGGAEGVFCVGNTRTKQGLALKTVDGAGRAVNPATVALLRQLNWLNDAQAAALEPFAIEPVRNVAGKPVGEIRPHTDGGL